MTAFSGNWFQRRSERRKAASEAYRRLLRHALDPLHYTGGGVPDTFEGRAGMVTVLTALTCVRFSELEGAEAARLIDRVNVLVLDGFDAAYRETGVGDASIARKVRKLAQNHAGLGKALFAALTLKEGSDPAGEVAVILSRNGIAQDAHIPALARSIIAARSYFSGQPDGEILHGRFDWAAAMPGG